MTINTHLILVSAQPIPNLTPILDEATRPQKVVMLVSADMQERSKALENIFKPRGISVERHQIADPWHARSISDQIDRIIQPYPPGGIALNATGGTKLMSIAAYEVFYSANQPVFYVHPEKDSLIWLNSDLQPHPLADRLKLEDYLTAYGAASVIRQPHGVKPAIKTLTTDLIANIENYAQALGMLNALAFQATQTLRIRIENKNRSFPAFMELLALFTDSGLCQLDNDNWLSFPGEEERFLVNGGWLEQHCYNLCLKLKLKTPIQDVACSINLTRLQGNKSVPNEIDVAMLANNHLFLIECKTKRFNDQNKNFAETSDVLYKLNTLRTLYGGTQARAMLVSFIKLEKHVRDRAKDLKIEVCSHTEIKRLENMLYDGLQPKR
jgi:hypothetical protein